MAEAETAPVPVIELRNVSKTFGEVRSLSGVDFSVRPGEIVGLLGDNGAGKFMGREPRTRWGLIDVKRMRQESSRLMSEHMGFTSAAVHPDNVVVTMSGGEKQGVAITRALHFDARLVILDEPSAALDPRAEAELFAQIREVFQGKTVVFISHRMATVRNADLIYVLDKGRIVEQGGHAALMDRRGLYAAMFNLQRDAYVGAADPTSRLVKPSKRASRKRPAPHDVDD